MSNSISIAMVTACLRSILEGAFRGDPVDAHPDASVTSLTPSVDTTNLPTKGANVFLFQVTPNSHWRNTDLPTRNATGAAVMRPRAAFDLHYIITFYGDDALFESQRLLGITVRTLHAQPTLSRSLITETITTLTMDPTFSFLNFADLAAAPELVRFSPSAISAEGLARVWSIFSFQTRFALSVVYQASVVLIDKDEPFRTALPVRIRNVYADAVDPPVIEQVASEDGVDEFIVVGSNIVISGRSLVGGTNSVGSGVLIRIDGEEVTTIPIEVTPTRIVVPLPSTLQAGPHGLQITRLRDMGTPPEPHLGLSSNLCVFVLHPAITNIATANITTSVVGSDTIVAGQLSLTTTPNIRRTQNVTVMLNEFNVVGATARSYTLLVPRRPDTDPPDSATITTAFDGVVAGTYLIRIQVDGAPSELTLDAGGVFYDEPKVTLP